MTAKEIYTRIAAALREGRPVYYTDGTVTRSIQKVELNVGGSTFRETLDILVDDCGGWRYFPIGIGQMLEYPYALAEYHGELYFAPTWWIAI